MSMCICTHAPSTPFDGVYVEEEDAVRFVPAAAPTRAELYVLTERVALLPLRLPWPARLKGYRW